MQSDKAKTDFFYNYEHYKPLLDKEALSLNNLDVSATPSLPQNASFEEFKSWTSNILYSYSRWGLRVPKLVSSAMCSKYLSENRNVLKALYEKHFATKSPEYHKFWSEIVKFSTVIPETTKGVFDSVVNGIDLLDKYMNSHNIVLCKNNPANTYSFLISIPIGDRFYVKQNRAFKSAKLAANVVYYTMMEEKASKGTYHHDFNISGLMPNEFKEYINLGKSLGLLGSEQEKYFYNKYSENQKKVNDYGYTRSNETEIEIEL